MTPKTRACNSLAATAPSLEHTLHGSLWAAALTPPEMAQVRAETYEIEVAAGSHAARIGELAHSWFGVIEGVLIMTMGSPNGKESTFTGVTNGGWFGEGTLLKNGLWAYNAVAVRDSRIACVPRETFQRLVQTSLPFNHFLLAHLNARLGLFISLVENDRLLGPKARVARCLASLFNPDIYPRTGRFIVLSQEESGHLAGLSRQRANRALQTLEQAGLLRIEFGGVTVNDLPGLRTYSHAPDTAAGVLCSGTWPTFCDDAVSHWVCLNVVASLLPADEPTWCVATFKTLARHPPGGVPNRRDFFDTCCAFFRGDRWPAGGQRSA